MGVLYLRVTISIPPEGDDKLTLNRWMYDFQRMPFWQYLLQDLQGRLRYFTLQEVRFFPFHYPNAVALLFYGSLSHYRLYIIAWDRGGGRSWSAGGRAVRQRGCPGRWRLYAGHGAAPIWNEGMYSYYAVPHAGAVLGHGGLALPVWVGEFPPPRLGCSGSAALLRRLRYL